jgi:carbon-monoxide dehydrogenase medium subunit
MDFVDARDLAEAFSTLDERGADATVLAGGTDVMVQYLRGEIAPPTLLYVGRVEALRGIEVDGQTRLGALTTHWELMTDPRVSSAHAALVEAAATVGGRQTQNVGTVAGNVVNASPAADLLPPLLVANAAVALASSSGSRELPLADFLLGRKQTARAPQELVTAVSLERPAERTGEVYVKVARRRAMEVAVVGLAARLAFATDGTVSDARIALCSVAPTPYRATEVETLLAGTTLDDDALAAAGEALTRSAAPIDDPRASAAYRRRVLAPLLRRAVAACRERARL